MIIIIILFGLVAGVTVVVVVARKKVHGSFFIIIIMKLVCFSHRYCNETYKKLWFLTKLITVAYFSSSNLNNK